MSKKTTGKSFIEPRKEGGFLVGYSEDRDYGRYNGPTAEVFIRDEWLYIITDAYEGVAMINVQALPKLRLALYRLSTTPPQEPADG